MSYYQEILTAMEEAFTQKAGYSPHQASDLGLRMEALAAQLAEQAQQVEELARQAFPATATGEYLDNHVAVRGLTRKPGAPAQGALTFSRGTAAGYDIFIPQGTLCQTEGEAPVQFVTLADALLEAEETQVTVAAQSVENTPQANVLAGTVTVMVTPPQGIAAVTNPEAFAGGEAPEEDQALRQRFVESCRAMSNGGNAGFYRQLALEQPGVASAAVLMGQRGAGSLDLVVFGQGQAPSQEQCQALQERINQEREIGVDVLVRAAQTTPVNLTVTVAPRSGWDFSAVSANCQAILRAYAQELGVGEPLYLAQMVTRIMDAGQVVNCQIVSPQGDTRPIQDRVLVLGTVTISQMEVV